MRSKRRTGGVVRALSATAVLVASTAMPALAQRGVSNSPEDAAVESTDVPSLQHPMQGMQRMQGMQCIRQGEAMRRGPGMPQSGESKTERERLEQMREHMVSGMRRMAVRMAAVQDRLAALERGDESAPPVEGGGMGCACGQGMGMQQGQGMQQGMGMQQGRGQGQGMQVRDGTGPGCQAAPPANQSGGDR